MVADPGAPATIGRRVARGIRPTSRARLLSLASDPGNWRPADVRPAFREDIAAADLPVAVRSWAYWLASIMTKSGDIALGGGIEAVVTASPASRATTYRYLRDLERRGLVERVAEKPQEVAPREWRSRTTLRIGAAFRPVKPEESNDQAESGSDMRVSQLRDIRGRAFSPTSVRSKPSRRNAGASGSEQIDPEDRRAVDDGWSRCARSRTDLPALRPGYAATTDDPAERARLMLPPLRPEGSF